MAVPEKIGKYEIVKQLGEGAMGAVYLARDPKIARNVAIKMIHRHLLEGDIGDEVRQRFIHEVRAVGQLRHPNIIAIYETDDYFEPGSETPIPYFVMEFVQGKELDRFLKAGERFSVDRTVNIIRQILQAFDYTHKHGIVHRDIKPANIFLTASGEAKIADFGIARIENSELTQMGSVLGTPNYMSPEQCAGQALDSRSDLFSIGIVFYEMLTGEKPFQGNSMHAVMHKIVNSIPDNPSLLNPAVPPGFDGVIQKALAKHPGDRFQTAMEFLVAVEQALQASSATQNDATVVVGAPMAGLGGVGDATVVAGGQPTLTRSEKTVTLGEPTVTGTIVAQTASTVRRWIPLVAGIVAAALVGGGAVIYKMLPMHQDVPSAAVPKPMGVPSGEQADAALMTDIDPATLSLPLADETVLSEDQREKVQRLLIVGEKHEKLGRMIWPPGSNALYAYRTVLEIEPANSKAREGVYRIANKLYQKAVELQGQSDWETLKAHLQISLEAFPKEKRLLEIQAATGKS